jgi:Sec-independent protein translocase protein TatA
MEILGIGMSELVFIIIIALIVLGPKDMQKAGQTIGRWLRSIVTSDGWRAFQQTSRELRTLPNRLMREANEDLNKIGEEIKAADPSRAQPNTINPPQRSRPSSPQPPAPPIPSMEKQDSPPPPVDNQAFKENTKTDA